MFVIDKEEHVLGKSAERRNELLHIALERFAKYGYHDTKISDIVKQAGVSQGTFYWHFKSKEAIAMEIIDTGRAEISQVILKGYRNHSGTVQDMVSASELLLTDLFLYARENRYLMELLLGGGATNGTIRGAVIETRIEMERAFRRNIQRAMELGMLPQTIDPFVRASFLMSLIEGTIARWLFGPTDPDSTITKKTIGELAVETARFEFFGLLGI